ncbi:glycosyltransferase family 39 protein [Segetibacter sp.]|uniref:ArnT family glycosyltransferase n=1 Tax=Segetibacter sp. TaxID=2231182 RepID=UPI0026217434|nr:glycosyltransferase family 39 protein [Segetibacter sp.]MCW3078866.1 glycosyltransferase family 39 protein [Segetibacter sp.]
MAVIFRYRVALILAFIKFLLPYLLQDPLYELHRDEMLYIPQGNHMGWGFMEVPPLLSVFSRLTILLGNSFFWIKFWPSLFGAINVVLVCKMAAEMGGKLFAQLIAGLSLIAGVYLRVHFLFQPNFLEIFFWTLSAYFIIRYINTNQTKYIYFLAVALALGWLSKYSVTFFGAGIVVGLLLTKNRKIFSSKHLYLAGLLAFVIILPNVLWQYNHKWPVVHHMKELRETQLQYLNPFDFLKDQVLMHLPCFFVWVGGLVWLLVFKSGRPYQIIAWMYVTVIVLLIASNGKNYYSLGAYPMLFAAGGVWIEQVTAVKRYSLRFVSVVIILILFVPLIPVLLPVWKPATLAAYYKKTGFDKAGVCRWEDLQDHPLPQDFADMISWSQMGEKVSAVYASLPDTTKSKTLIFCRNYALAGATTYYGKGLGQVTSDNASFLFWMPDTYNIKNLLFVGRRIPGKDDLVFQQFEKYTVIDSITTPMARERGVKIILYENGNDKVNAMIGAGIKEKKDEYRR